MALNVFILAVLLTVGFVGTRLASYLRIPHSVFLVFLGVAFGVFLHEHSSASATYVSSIVHAFPDIVLYVLLPPLIFDSSYRLDFSELVGDIAPLTVLAVGALLISTALIGIALHLVFHLGLLPSLTFGALISATDPVAVVALFREIGAPKRLETLIEGESLLNDGTAMVLFRLLLGLSMAATALPTTATLAWTTGQFLYVVGAGIIIGLAVALLLGVLLRLVSHAGSPQLGLTVASAYLSFIIAEHFFHVSGVIATMTVGLYLGNRARVELNREAAEGIGALWEFLSLTANTLVFFAVGLSVDVPTLLSTFRYIPLTLTFVYAARAISVYGTIPLVNRLGGVRPIPLSYQTVLFWGGLRGGLALGLALTLPLEFPHRGLFIALAISVVFATLFVNAVTAKWVLELLKLNLLDERERALQNSVLTAIEDSASGELATVSRAGLLSPALLEDMKELSSRAARPRSMENQTFSTEFAALTSLIAERSTYEERLRSGSMTRDAYREVDRLLRIRLECLNEKGIAGLRDFSFPLRSSRSLMPRRFERLSRRSTSLFLDRLSIRFETLQAIHAGLTREIGKQKDEVVRDLLGRWLGLIDEKIREIYRAYPHYGSAVQGIYVAKFVRGRGRVLLDRYFTAGVINQAIYADTLRKLKRVFDESTRRSLSLLRPSHAYLFSRLSFFQRFPKIGIRRIAESSKVSIFEPGKVVAKKGETAQSFFLIASGMLEQVDSGEERPRLFSGDHFGWEEMLSGRPYPATIRALVSTEVLKLDHITFERILYDYPSVKEALGEGHKKGAL